MSCTRDCPAPTFMSTGCAVLEHDQRRHGAHIVLRDDAGIGLDVELDDLHLAGEFDRQVVEDGIHRLAGRAPLGPEIDQHRLAGAQHFGVEIGIVDLQPHLYSIGK